MSRQSRLQIDLNESQIDSLDRLLDETKLSTKKDLFNNAITLFEWVVDEIKKGHIIASIDEKTQNYRVLQMPVLNNVQRRFASHTAA